MMLEVDFDPIAYINEPRWQTSRLGLERIAAALDALGRPQDALSFVHVAGTNGKGSTCAYLASICQAAGLKTGLFTSPYIERFEERIQINGKAIALDDLRDVTLKVRAVAEAQAEKTGDHLTEFELMCAVALVYFAQQSCDIVVLEVGLGGRLDSTNVIDRAEVDVITRIALDHTAILGDTLEAIAQEKAAIIKPGADVVSAPQADEVRQVIESVSAARFVCDTDLKDCGIEEQNAVFTRCFSYKTFSDLQTTLLATYQTENAALAIEAALALCERGFALSDDAIYAGIAQATWPGRFEVVAPGQAGQTLPAIIVDGGHNPQGAQALAQSLRDVFPGRRVVFVMSVLADKDFDAMIEAVADLADAFVVVTPNNPRALLASQLKAAVCNHQGLDHQTLKVVEATNYDEAFASALNYASAHDVICFFGSLYAIGDIKAVLRRSGVLS